MKLFLIFQPVYDNLSLSNGLPISASYFYLAFVASITITNSSSSSSIFLSTESSESLSSFDSYDFGVSSSPNIFLRSGLKL